jgi:hypothetical protein
VPVDAISDAFTNAGLDPRVRAEDISLSQLAELYRALGSSN